MKTGGSYRIDESGKRKQVAATKPLEIQTKPDRPQVTKPAQPSVTKTTENKPS